MKRNSGSYRLPVMMLIWGIAALVLRKALYATAVDVKGLLLRYQPLEIALTVLTIGVLAWMDKLNVPGVLIAAFLAAIGSVFFSPAARTVMIDIIPHDDMVRGQSIFSGVNPLINMMGTAFSGVMVAFFGVPLIVVINGLSNLYSAFSELFIRVPRTVRQGEAVTVKGLLKDFGGAVRQIFRSKALALFVPCALILNLLGAGPLALVLPFCMEKGFTVDMYGYLMAVWTASALVCVLVLGIVKLSPRVRYWVMAVSFVLSVVFFGLTYLANSFVPMCIAAALASATNCAGNTIFNAALMLALPEDDRGAVLGFIQAASTGGTALSTVIFGVLGDVMPLYLVFTVGNLISLGPMLYLCLHRETKKFVLEH